MACIQGILQSTKVVKQTNITSKPAGHMQGHVAITAVLYQQCYIIYDMQSTADAGPETAAALMGFHPLQYQCLVSL